MSASYTKSVEELEEHLREQLAFLQSSAEAFDAGSTAEAVRLAVGVRILVHDKNSSSSLLTQLGKKNQRWSDSAKPFDPNAQMAYTGLIEQELATDGPSHIAFLDDLPPGAGRWVDFDAWWQTPVFKDAGGGTMSRRDVVLHLADKEGGAHVDPKLTGVYVDISRFNSLRFLKGNFRPSEMIGQTVTMEPFPGVIPPAMRQIAHEVLKTLVPGYSKRPQYKGIVIGIVGMTFR